MTTPRKSMMPPRSAATRAVYGDGPPPVEEEDEPTPAPAPKKPRKKREDVTASERTVTVTAPTWTPPERETTEQLNVRIPKSMHDWVKEHHRTTGEPMRSIVERALTLLRQTEEK